ncbi:hypothetical protein HK405_011739 [Cladochytrium tenue]|nr:hypothetical protein HK405_011739 [Cladochytrium tenue]
MATTSSEEASVAAATWTWQPPPPRAGSKRPLQARDNDEDDGSDADFDERYLKYYRLTEDDLSASSPVDAAGRDHHPTRTFRAYERHYDLAHCNACAVCRRTLPTRHLLDLHVQEVHDSFFRALAERENSYECFVDGCPKKFSSPFKRRLHLVDKHRYPKHFDFDVVLGSSPTDPPLPSSRRARHVPHSRRKDRNSAMAAAAAERNTQSHCQPASRHPRGDSEMAVDIPDSDSDPQLCTDDPLFAPDDQAVRASAPGPATVSDQVTDPAAALTSHLASLRIAAPPAIRFGRSAARSKPAHIRPSATTTTTTTTSSSVTATATTDDDDQLHPWSLDRVRWLHRDAVPERGRLRDRELREKMTAARMRRKGGAEKAVAAEKEQGAIDEPQAMVDATMV